MLTFEEMCIFAFSCSWLAYLKDKKQGEQQYWLNYTYLFGLGLLIKDLNYSKMKELIPCQFTGM